MVKFAGYRLKNMQVNSIFRVGVIIAFLEIKKM